MRRLIISFAFVLTAACGPTIGDACTTNTDCGGAVCLNRDFTPGGACTTSCELGTNDSCPTGSTCVRDALGPNAPGCMRMCRADNACRTGYICKSANGSVSVCIGPQGI